MQCKKALHWTSYATLRPPVLAALSASSPASQRDHIMNLLASLSLTLLFALPSLAIAENAPSKSAEQLFQNQMTALTSSDYETFFAHTDDAFKQAVPPDQFASLSEALSGHFAAGYEAENLGVLRQEGLLIHLWKVTPHQADTDYLVKMALRGNTIAGFWIQ